MCSGDMILRGTCQKVYLTFVDTSGREVRLARLSGELGPLLRARTLDTHLQYF
jgi:hypothetical protein